MAEHSHDEHGSGGSGVAGRVAFWGFILIAAYFLISEHRAHVAPYLPFLLLLACPFLHMFHGHGGHGGPSSREQHGEGTKRSPEPSSKKASMSTQHGGH